jgi:hypothetical protein
MKISTLVGPCRAFLVVATLLSVFACRREQREQMPISNQRYISSADYSDQWVYVSNSLALVKRTKVGDGLTQPKVSYSVALGHYDGEPEYEWASGNIADAWLAQGAVRIARIEVRPGECKLLIDNKSDSTFVSRYWLIDIPSGNSISGTNTTNLLAQLNAERVADSIHWWDASLFFDLTRDSLTRKK